MTTTDPIYFNGREGANAAWLKAMAEAYEESVPMSDPAAQPVRTPPALHEGGQGAEVRREVDDRSVPQRAE